MRRTRIGLSIVVGVATCVCWAVAAKGADGPPADRAEPTGVKRAPSMFAIDAKGLLPVPQDAPRYRFFVDADGGVTGGDVGDPGDERQGVCLPEGGTCGPIVYKNMEPKNVVFHWNGVNDFSDGDGAWLAGTERDVCQVVVPTFGQDGVYSYTLEIWTDCPSEGGATLLYGPVHSGMLPIGYSETTFAIPGVEVSSYLWLDLKFTAVTATDAGPILRETAEIGWTDELRGIRGGDPPTCQYYTYSIAFQVSAAGSDNGKCCYNDCANCADETYGDCMARPGNPEFLLGASCATGPGCAKGACCTAEGTCLDNVDPNDPNCVVGTWTLGSTCTHLAPHSQKFCAPPPDNDKCVDAELIEGTCATKYFNTAGADAGVDDPNDPPFTSDDSYYTVGCLRGTMAGMTEDDTQVANNIWYKWTVPTIYEGYAVTDGRVVISTLGSQFDTVLQVYATEGVIDCVACVDVGTATEVPGGCNDDIVPIDYTSHEHMQLSFIEVVVDNTGWVRPGACLLIMVGGLSQEGNPPGGPGQLNIDFVPTGAPWNAGSGVCCTAEGCFMATGVGILPGECDFASGQYFRPSTDFYEGATNPPLPAPFEAKAHGCCHGDFGSCVEGEFCGHAIVLSDPYWKYRSGPDSNFVWPDDFPPATGLVHRVTYFSFTPRDCTVADQYEDPEDPTSQYYYITIDTCGSEFDTVLSLYGPNLVNPRGECSVNQLIARNDDCTLSTPGAEGRISCTGVATTESCMCVKVGGLNPVMVPGWDVCYIGVGRKDTRAGIGLPRAEGIDPVPNYPLDPAVGLKLTMVDTWTDCEPCDKDCCKGDMNNDWTINGKDIKPFIDAVMAPPPCRVAGPGDPEYKMWCRANMDGSAVVDIDDVPLFVNALLIPFECDFSPYCEVEGYCQLPDYPMGAGGIISDLNESTKIADNFVSPTGGQISRVCWWGFYKFRIGSTWQACTPPLPDDDFTITFYSNWDNRPADVLAQYSNISQTGGTYTLVATLTGRTVAEVPEYRYEVTGLPPVAIPAGECVWIEIVNNTGTGDCWWLWETQTNAGDTYAAEWQYDYYRWFADTDLAFCVNIPIYDRGCPRTCLVPCPEGSIDEGEADCGVGFVDTTNGGCWLESPLFTDVESGNTYCGTTGIWEEGGYRRRDSDWYEFMATGGSVLTAGFAMDFNLLYYVIDGSTGCTNWIDNVIESWSIVPCATGVTIDTILPSAGTYWLLIIPDFDYGFDQPCGSEYSINVSWVAAATGACCNGTTCVATNTEYKCCSLSPNYVWYRGQNCGSFSCPTNNTLLWDNYPCTAAAPDGATASQKSTGDHVFNAQVADDFIFTTARTVSRARWIGSYYGSGENTITGFRVFIYNNNVDRPTGAGLANPETTAIYNQLIPIANVTQIAGAYSASTQYEAALPVNFSATANTRYWIVFQAELVAFPLWGISQSETQLGIQARTGFPLLGTQFWNGTLAGGDNDMAFKLMGS